MSGATVDNQVIIDRLRENIPPEEKTDDPLEQLREFSQWLLIVPIIMIILFGCGQLALFTTSEAALASTNSGLSAEYGPWPYMEINRFRDDILDEIKSDGRSYQISNDTYNDPVDVGTPWVDGELPPIVIADAPEDPTPPPTEPSEGNPTSTPLGSGDPTDTPIPTSTGTPSPTVTQLPTSTDNPSATRTYTPTPSRTPAPTVPGGPTSTNTPTATNTPLPTNTSTNTPTPTDTPDATDTPPPPPDYCSNINWNGGGVTNWQGMGTVIKFDTLFKNNNSIPMTLTSYSISWTDNGLSLHRGKADLGNGSRPKIANAKGSSPQSCTGCPVTFIAQPGYSQEIYNMFCVSTNCSESADDDPIAAGTYSFTMSGTFTFYGSSTVNCNFSKNGSITMP